MPKRTLKRYDSQPAVTGGGGEAFAAAENIAAPVPAILEAPSGLVATSTEVARSAATPNAYVNLTWFAPNTAVTVTTYEIDVVRFGGVAERYTAYQTSAQIVLDAATQYAFRVRARYDYQVSAWSAAVIITTFADTTTPGVPTSPVLAFIGAGDAVITHVPATSMNYRDTEIKILSQAGGTLYGTFFDATGRITWTTTQNNAATSGVGDVSLYVEMRSRSWSNVFSAIVNTGLITKAAPTAPTVTADFSGVDCVYTITPPADAAAIRFVADTAVTARDIGVVGRYAYVFDQNRLDHSGTADPVLSYSFTTVDGLGQVSAATTGTATNAAPSAPSTVVVNGFLGVMSIAITTGTLPTDFARYQVRVIQTLPSAADVLFVTTNTLLTRAIDTPATYQVGVRIVDVFSQTSTETLSTATVIDALTLGQLRSAADYSDSIATAPATLNVLKDGNIVSGGFNYAAGGISRFIRMTRSLVDRYKTITLSMDTGGGAAAVWYVRTSLDGITWRNFAGPLTGTVLTEYALAATADANKVTHTTLGNSAASRVDLPVIVDARFVEVIFSNSAIVRVDEFYPRRLVQSDDMEAESIRAINIAAGAVTAPKISVAQLSAITADMGSLTAGTITGATIRTSAANPRVEMNSASLTTYDAGGVVQVQASSATGGKLTAGAGAVVVDSTGISVLNNTTGFPLPQNGYVLRDGSSNTVGGVFGLDISSSTRTVLNCTPLSGRNADIEINALYAISGTSSVNLNTNNTQLQLNNSGVKITGGGLNVGTATGAGTGQIATSGSAAIGTSISSAVRLLVRGATATAGQYAINAKDSAGVDLFFIENNGAGYLNAAAWTYSSDARLKEQVVDYAGGLDVIKQLQPRQFSYIGNTAVEYGFIAQEVQKVLPHLVVAGVNDMLGLKTTNLIPVLVNAVKELQKRIERMEARCSCSHLNETQE